MYLLILEDGEVLKTETLHDEDKEASDHGIMDIIHVSGEHPRQYFQGEFHEIKVASPPTTEG